MIHFGIREFLIPPLHYYPSPDIIGFSLGDHKITDVVTIVS